MFARKHEKTNTETKKIWTLGNINDIDEGSFASPVLTTVKSHKNAKLATELRKLIDSCMKMRPHTTYMEELGNQISVEITRYQTVQCHYSNQNHPVLRIRTY